MQVFVVGGRCGQAMWTGDAHVGGGMWAGDTHVERVMFNTIFDGVVWAIIWYMKKYKYYKFLYKNVFILQNT